MTIKSLKIKKVKKKKSKTQIIFGKTEKVEKVTSSEYSA